jgi:hypothetical protein
VEVTRISATLHKFNVHCLQRNMSVRECSQCKGTTKKHKQCSRTTCKLAPDCFQHLRSSAGLAVKKSTIAGAGQGLFTLKPIKKGTKVASYTGDVLTKPQFEQRYGIGGHGAYTIQLGKDRFIDARSTQSSVARYANACDKPGGKRPCNCRLTSGAGRAVLRTTKVVPKNSELFTPYGKDYWS